MKKKLILLSILTGVLIIVSFGVWFFAHPQAETSCRDVMVYKAANYSGTSACFAPGQYTLANLRSKGITNDSISSIKMPSGFKLTAFSDDNFSGESIDFIQSVADLRTVPIHYFRTWNDEISSLKIVYTTCPSPLSETRTSSCPAPQTGSITQTRTKGSAPGCTWGEWKETSNTCKEPAEPAPTVNLKANDSDGPITVDYNSTVKLSWTTLNADSCSASGGWSGAKDDNGEETSPRLTTSTTFTLTCSRNGSSSDSVTMEVNAEPTPTPIPESIPTSTPTPAPAENQSDIQSPSDSSVANTTEPSDSTNGSLTEQIIDQGSGETQENQSTQKTNPWIYVVIILVLIGGGVYIFIRIRNTQLTSEDLLREGGEVAPTEETPTALPPPPPASTSSPSSPLPPNVPSTTIPPENTDDMDID